jgi:hypothetical protein
MANAIGTIMWYDRSSSLSLIRDTRSDIPAAQTYGGATSNRVWTRDWLNVATKVGMKDVTAPAVVFVIMIRLLKMSRCYTGNAAYER